MKRCLLLLITLWITMAVELTSPRAIPRGALLLPVCCGAIYWTRNASGLLCCGLGLLVDWIARPTSLPLCPMILPALAAVTLAPVPHHDGYRSRGSRPRLPVALQLPLLTASAATLQIVSLIPVEAWSDPSPLFPELLHETRSLLLIALPLSAMGSLLIRLADEFGIRRAHQF
ncbi:MAG: hypothetical protein ACK58L_11520 [Planctomycetota bacterium]